MRSLSPREVTVVGLRMLAQDLGIAAGRAGDMSDIKAAQEKARALRAKADGIMDGSVLYMPILDDELRLAYRTAVERIKG